MTTAIDLNPRHLDIVERILAEYVPGCEVRAFGSRAAWTARDYSDVDLAVVGDGPLHWRTLSRLREAFEESRLPMRVDVLDWHAISEGFRETIKSDCVVVQEADAPMEWPKVRLGACVVTNELTVSPEKEGWPYVNYLDTGSITENRIDEVQHLVVGEDKVPVRARRKVGAGDIVYSTVRPNQRHYGRLKNVPENLLASTGFAIIRGRDGVADTGFIYWFLAQDHIVEHLQAIAEHSTSAYPSIRPGDIEAIEFPLPPLEEQRAIARVLGALDDKIALNRRMSETLEEMARALFRSWFINFDPVRAKAEGRPSGLPPDLDALFPASFEASELGEIPAGWEMKTLGDVVTQLRDNENPMKAPTTMFSHFSIPAYDEGQVPRQEVGEAIRSAKTRVKPGVVLLSKLNPEIERVWLPDVAPGDRAICSTEFLVLEPRPPFQRGYIYCLARSAPFRGQIESLVTGTSKSHQRAGANAVLGLPTVIAPEPLVQAFEQRASDTLDQTLRYRRSSVGLAAQRDALLPRLVSGELRLVGMKSQYRLPSWTGA